MNVPAYPSWTVYKTSEPTASIGKTVNYVAVAAMTTANLDRINTFTTLNPETLDPSRADVRQYFADTFLVLWRHHAVAAVELIDGAEVVVTRRDLNP